MLELSKKLTFNQDLLDSPNLCDRFDEVDLTRIGTEVWNGYRRDRFSRMAWEGRMNAAMDLAMQVQRSKNFPWPNCANVVFPLVTIAALQFSARSYANIIQGTNVVRYRTMNTADPLQIERAKRLGRHMSWQVLEQDEGWEEQHDRCFINLAIIGSNFIKSYFEPSKGYPVSELVMAKDLVIDYYARSVESAARKSHEFAIYRNDIYEGMVRGIYTEAYDEAWFKGPAAPYPQDLEADKRLGRNPPQADMDSAFTFIEQHRWFDFDGDGYYEPYICTIEKTSKKVQRIVARVEDMAAVEKIRGRVAYVKATEYFTKYSFIPSPDGGIYDLGFGIFLGPINEAVNSGLNQMIDFGTMQNSLGGLLARGAKIRGGVYTMAPWEFKRVDSSGDDLRKSIFMWPDRSPPDFMLRMITLLIEYANRVAGTVDATVGENPGQNTPASTFQGMTEQGMQTYKMCFKRLWRSMKLEMRRRYELNKVFLREEESFGSTSDLIRREDYSLPSDFIAPVANPNITSVMMRIQQAVAVKADAAGTPGYDLDEVTVAYLETLEVENLRRLYPGPGKVPKGHEMQNPKAMAEMLKLQGKQLDIKAKQMEWANQLMEDRRLNTAKIKLIEAQAMQAAAETDGAKAAAQIERFEQLVTLHKEYNAQLNDRIKSLLGEAQGNGSSNVDDEGGVSGVEGASGDSNGNAVSVRVPGGSQVSVGNGAAK